MSKGTESSPPKGSGATGRPLTWGLLVVAGLLFVAAICNFYILRSHTRVLGDGSTRERSATRTIYEGRPCWVGFDEYLVIKNTTAKEKFVTCKYTQGSGKSFVEQYDVGPLSGTTVNVRSATGDQGYRSLKVYQGSGVKVTRVDYNQRLSDALAALPNRDQAKARVGSPLIGIGNTAAKRVALTFDTEISDVDPHGCIEATNVILDILKENNVKATFFVTGKFAEGYPELILRMAYEGHDIGNHSYDHPDFQKITDEQVTTEVCWTDDVVRKTIGESTKPYFRFPGGRTSDHLVKKLAELGYLSLHWTTDTADWTGVSPQALINSVVGNARPGNIYLLHNVFPSQKAAALPTIIKELKQRGYEPCGLTETLSI